MAENQIALFNLSEHIDDRLVRLKEERCRLWCINYKQKQRTEAKSQGLCAKCLARPRIIQRTQCVDCQISSLVREAFKFDRGATSPEARAVSRARTANRGTCYVDQFYEAIRQEWINKIKGKYNGKCAYTGIPIEVGSTASIDHSIPVCRAHVFGPSKVWHPDNLVWCHKSVNYMKGQMTGDEFREWLKQEFVSGLREAGVI